MKDFRAAKTRVDVSVGESARILRELFVVIRRYSPFRAGTFQLKTAANPAVNPDAPVYAFVLNDRPGRRAGYLIR